MDERDRFFFILWDNAASISRNQETSCFLATSCGPALGVGTTLEGGILLPPLLFPRSFLLLRPSQPCSVFIEREWW